MKYIITPLIILVGVVVGLYFFIFSESGNAIVASKLEKRLKEELALESLKIHTFFLKPDYFDINLSLTQTNNIQASGKFDIFNETLDATYDVALHDLLALESLLKNTLSGKLNIQGSASGNMKQLLLKGVSDIARSQTKYSVVLDDFKPTSIHATMKGANLKELFILLNQPYYCDGLLDLYADNLILKDNQLNGSLNTKITKGVINSQTIESHFNIKNIPSATFSLDTNSLLSEKNIDTKIVLLSSIADINIEKLSLNTQNMSFKSDYVATVKDLENLRFITHKTLRGGIKVNGNIAKESDLVADATSDFLGGKIDANLINSDLKIEISSIKSLGLLNMLYYPEVFDGSLDGLLTYNIENQKGLFDAKLSDGKMVENEMSILVRELGRFDLTRERFDTTLKSSIDRELIVSDLNMTSLKSSITGEKIAINTKDEKIDAQLNLNINDNRAVVEIQGYLADPIVKINANELLKNEAKKLLQDKFGDKMNSILDKLF